MICPFATTQPKHSFYILAAMDNVVRRFVDIAHQFEHRLFIHIEERDNADDFLFMGVVGRVNQLHGWSLFPVAFVHPGSQLRIRNFAEAMVWSNNVGFCMHNFLLRCTEVNAFHR